MPKEKTVADLIEAKTKVLTPDQLANLRRVLASDFPAFLDQSVIKATNGDQEKGQSGENSAQ